MSESEMYTSELCALSGESSAAIQIAVKDIMDQVRTISTENKFTYISSNGEL